MPTARSGGAGAALPLSAFRPTCRIRRNRSTPGRMSRSWSAWILHGDALRAGPAKLSRLRHL
jgi:hypothetical protein